MGEGQGEEVLSVLWYKHQIVMTDFDVLLFYLLQNEDTQSEEEEGRQQLPYVPDQDPRRASHRGLKGGQAAGELHPSWRTH